MMKKILTDAELRANWPRSREKTYCVEAETVVTPSAMDFLREHGVTLCRRGPDVRPAAMSRTPVPVRNGRPVYIDDATGEELPEKPEEMTHLRGNRLVPKTHPRIEFRGRLDSLMAQVMRAQLAADECGETRIAGELQELLEYARRILGAEVKEEPLPEIRLLGMSGGQLRDASHRVEETLGVPHPVPHYKMGRMCVELNLLRTQVREAELAAVRAFRKDGVLWRRDIVEGLNRMSSGVYVIFCRKIAGYYEREDTAHGSFQ